LPATPSPHSVNPVVADAELVALGDQLQRLWPEYLAARDAFNEEEADDGPAKTKYDAIDWQTCKLAEKIIVIPAHTMAGLRVKVMVAIYDGRDGRWKLLVQHFQ
jgi:hypothetical protein